MKKVFLCLFVMAAFTFTAVSFAKAGLIPVQEAPIAGGKSVLVKIIARPIFYSQLQGLNGSISNVQLQKIEQGIKIHVYYPSIVDAKIEKSVTDGARITLPTAMGPRYPEKVDIRLIGPDGNVLTTLIGVSYASGEIDIYYGSSQPVWPFILNKDVVFGLNK